VEDILFDVDQLDKGSVSTDYSLGIYDDTVVVVYGTDSSGKYKVLIYDRSSGSLNSLELGDSVENTAARRGFISMNSKKHLVLSNPNGRYDFAAQIVHADLSQGIKEAPTVTISTSQEVVSVGDTITLAWNVDGDIGEISKYEIYKVVNGVDQLLHTITNPNVQSYVYTQTQTEEYANLKVKLTTVDGLSSIDQKAFSVMGNVTFSGLTTSASTSNLGDNLELSWSQSGATSLNTYTGYRKCNDESNWKEIFVTNDTTYSINNDMPGTCEYKIVSGSSEIVTTQPVLINGTLYKFKQDSLVPRNTYNLNNGRIAFSWDTYFDDSVEIIYTAPH